MGSYSRNSYPQFITKIIKGEGVAGKLGFPTINLDYKSLTLDIPFGIYVCVAKVGKKNYKGALHFGPQLTLSPTKTSLEAHLLDFKGLLRQHQIVSVKLIQYLRQIKKFQTIKDLQNAIKADVNKARKCLQESGKSAISARNWHKTTLKAKGTVF